MWVFLVFLFDCVFFTPSLFCPPFNPPCHHTPSPRSHSLHHSPHPTTPWHTQHATQPRVCAVVSVCVSLSACSFLTQPKPRHAIQSPYPPHIAPPMHEPMSVWEGAVACADTTAQTSATTTKPQCHSHYLLSFLPSIGNPHSSQHHHANTHATRQDLLNTNTLADLPTTHML